MATATTETTIIIITVIRHLLAPHVPRAAVALDVQRTLPGAAGVAITFDDGPHPEGTPAVLEILAAADIKATFFLVGEQVERRPALAAEIAAQGHLVALHGYRHRPQPAMTPKAVQADLERGADVVQAGDRGRTGLAPAPVRPVQPRRPRAPSARSPSDRCCGPAGARIGGGSRRPNGSRPGRAQTYAPAT